ncbi:hypothetical protein [Bosea sp. WAO]|uniref:hypothetical protein n=1 Tax=Bosea sp. WAO TaxID=406341 RepID=UPI0012ECC1AA|nr:hypothetical protein [Bosea sp. WAO]
MTDEEIEQVARGMCTALGLNPETRVEGGVYDDDTPDERSRRFAGHETIFTPDVMVRRPLWRLYRWKAAEVIAAQSAPQSQP